MVRRTGVVRRKKWLILAAALLAALILAGCGNVGSGSGNGPQASGGSSGGKGPVITVGSKNFTEEIILGNMYADALKAHGFQVQKKMNLGSVAICDRALQRGQIDLYPEYTGTSLEAVFHKSKTPKTPQATYQEAKKLYAARNPSDTMLQPAPYNNTYGIFVRKPVAEKYHLKTLSDLAKASPHLVFYSFSEFQHRQDGFPNIKRNYPNMNFKKTVVVNSIGLRYQGVLRGEGDVGIGFTTDGQLRSPKLVVLEDTKHIWPWYQPAPVVRTSVLKKHPEIKKVLDEVSSHLSAKTMRRLNGEVDLDHKDPDRVARQFLKDQGLIK